MKFKVKTRFKLSTIFRIAWVLTIFGLPTIAWAQTTATGTASAEVQEIPISLVEETPLSFGTFMPFGRPGIVGVDANGTFASTDVYIVTQGQWGLWHTFGVIGAFYELTHSSGTTLTNGGDTMDVTGIHINGYDGAIQPAGYDTFTVGATLNVNPNQPPGVYSGTYELTVVYN